MEEIGAVPDSQPDKRDSLSTYFCYGYQIRRLIYTTNTIEGFNRQLRKVTKSKAVFPGDEALRKSLMHTRHYEKMEYAVFKPERNLRAVCD